MLTSCLNLTLPLAIKEIILSPSTVIIVICSNRVIIRNMILVTLSILVLTLGEEIIRLYYIINYDKHY